MLPLYATYFDLIHKTFFFIYVYTGYLSLLVFFYPVGLLISLILLWWLFRMLIWSSVVLLNWYKSLVYIFFLSISKDQTVVFQSYKTFLPALSLLYSLLYFFSNYSYVFFNKRAEIYFFLIFFICLFTF